MTDLYAVTTLDEMTEAIARHPAKGKKRPLTPAAARRKGASAETELTKALIDAGHHAVRLHLNGTYDQGDILVFHDNTSVTVYEVKSVVRLDLPGALRELATEVANTRAARPGITVKGILAIRLKGGRWAMVTAWPPS